MILSLVLALAACSTPEAPKPAPVAAPAPAPVAPPPAPVTAPMPADMPGMAMGGDDKKEAGEEKEEALPPTVIPATPAGIVADLKKDRDTIKGLIDGGKLKDVHPIARQVMDLATALPGKATSLAGADKGTVALKCVDIKDKADAMHDAADDGNAADTKTAFGAVSADIDAIAALVK